MAVKLSSHSKDLGGFSVTRILPNIKARMVGPFIFVDHMGPADFSPGEGIDVRPHPHIGLSTITYLLEGSMLHRDSLGNNMEILPGDVNWMTAGRGIVHSERETIEVKSSPHRVNGMQCWVALPKQFAELEPAFTHIRRCQLPHYMKQGLLARLIAGEAYGMSSRLKTYSPMFYLDVLARAGRTIPRPNPSQECMVYVLDGRLSCDDEELSAGDCVLLEDHPELAALEHSRVLLLGGEAWDETPFIDWNFVSFSKERIEQAKQDWRDGHFAKIPGDSEESIPLP